VEVIDSFPQPGVARPQLKRAAVGFHHKRCHPVSLHHVYCEVGQGLEKGRRPLPIDLVIALAVALDAPLLALLSPLDGSRVHLGDERDVPSDEFQLWVQGLAHLPGMDLEAFLKTAIGLKIPKEALQRVRASALAMKRQRLADELKRIDKELEGD
jgi:hypothetical protein